MDDTERAPATEPFQPVEESTTHGPKPPIAHLLRKLKLAQKYVDFGGELEVGVFSNLVLDPETVCRIVYDCSLDGAVTRFSAEHHATLHKIRYNLAGKNQSTETTLTNIAQTFESVVPINETKAVLRGDQSEHGWLDHRPWELIVMGMDASGEPSPEDLQRNIAGYLADREAQVSQWVEFQQKGKPLPHCKETEKQLAAGLDAWKALNPKLLLTVLLVIEEALASVAHFDVLLSPAQAGDGLRAGSGVLPYLLPSHRPLGHWLKQVARASGCSSLAQLGHRYVRLGVGYKDENKKNLLKHDLLKKWSSGNQLLMPFEALDPVLKALKDENHINAFKQRYYLARILTFLCRLLQAGTAGDRPDLKLMQTQLESRYTAVYRLELLRVAAKN